MTRAAWVSDALWARIQRGRRLLAAEWALAREMQMRASVKREEVDRQFEVIWTGTLERQGACPGISSYRGGSQLSPVQVERYRLEGGDPLSPNNRLKRKPGAE